MTVMAVMTVNLFSCHPKWQGIGELQHWTYLQIIIQCFKNETEIYNIIRKIQNVSLNSNFKTYEGERKKKKKKWDEHGNNYK